MIVFVRPPKIFRLFFKPAIWVMNSSQRTIYLTFDDGPIPDLTPWVLDTLKKFDVKATFFCVGENIQKHPDIFERILKEGHQVGNHTYNHIKGWKVNDEEYFDNIEKCQAYTQTNLFRPPYGRIKRSQLKALADRYKIIMWDVLSYDYDKFIGEKQCLINCLKYTRSGSIVVFHDNIKAQKNLKFVLPQFIQHFQELNYKFAIL